MHVAHALIVGGKPLLITPILRRSGPAITAIRHRRLSSRQMVLAMKWLVCSVPQQFRQLSRVLQTSQPAVEGLLIGPSRITSHEGNAQVAKPSSLSASLLSCQPLARVAASPQLGF